MKYRVGISARNVGAIGAHGTVQRSYEIDLPGADHERSDISGAAILRAYQDGDIEHVRVHRIERLAS